MNTKAACTSIAVIVLTAPMWVGAAEPDAENERSVAERVHAAIQLAAASSTPQSRNPGASKVSERIHAWLLVEDEPWVRYYLVTALMRLGHKRDDSFLLELAQDCDPTFRRMAALTSMDCYDDDLNREQISGYALEDVWWARSALLEAMRFRTDDESLE